MVSKNNLSILIRVFSYSILAFTLVFLINNILTIWFDWPGLKKLFAHHELFGFKKLNKSMEGLEINLSYIQLFFYVISFAFVLFFVFKSLKQSLNTDAGKINENDVNLEAIKKSEMIFLEGYLWDEGDWGIFFIITAIMVIPSLIFLYMIKDKLKLND